MKKNLLVTIIISLFCLGGGFFAGLKYQQNKISARFRQFSNQNFNRISGQGRISRVVNGEILSVEEKSLTVKLQDGSSKIILFSQDTQINKAQQATTQDLKEGEKIAVFGLENSDGTITAQNIQLNPIFRGSFLEQRQ